MVESSKISHCDSSDDKSSQWLAWDEIEREALLQEGDKYYLPKVLVMQISSFLNHYELSKLDACSSYIRYCTQGHYQQLYKNLSKQITNEAFGASSQNEDFRRMYSQLVTKRPFQISATVKVNPHKPELSGFIASELQFFNQPSQSQKIVKQVLLGGKLNAYLSLQGELSVQTISTAVEDEKEEEKAQSFQIQQPIQEIMTVPHKVEKASIAGTDLVYLDEFGMVHAISAVTENNENLLKLPRLVDLKDKAKIVSVGFSHAFAITELNEVYTWILQPKDDNLLNNHKSFKIEGIPLNTELIDMKSGNFQTIILTKTGQVYKIEHSVPKEGFLTDIISEPLKAIQLKKLSNIVNISANCNHFLALERNDTQPLREWGSEKVYEWFKNIGLGDCSNIIKYQKINGEQIENADNNFLAGTLGILQEVEQDKLRFVIGEVNKGVIGESKVWGWGNNKQGQLALYGMNNVPEPKIIPLPEINDAKIVQKGHKDYIVSVECGKKHSAFITYKKEVWIAGNYVPDKIQSGPAEGFGAYKGGRSLSGGIDPGELSDEERKAVMTLPGAQSVLHKNSKNSKSGSSLANPGKKSKKLSHKEQEQQTYEEYLERSETYKNNKEHLKKQKNHLNRYVQELKDVREEHKTQNDRENSVQQRWICITKSFTREAFGPRGYKVESLVIGSRQIVAICSIQIQKAKSSTAGFLDGENKYRKGENKFRGGDVIIKKLLYLAEANPHQKYTVCYEDRIFGLVESEVSRFYYGSETPLHRIKLFKCDGQLIWDRKKKFSLL